MEAILEATESALIVAVPQAEAAVATLRSELDPAASWGVPAHVTVVYPFLPPSQIGAPELARLAAAVHAVPSFDVTFAQVAWFGEQVVWLRPEPDHGFRALTAAVWTAFPECPPYGGAYSDPIPHLTVGDGADPERLRAAAQSVGPFLPIRAEIRAVQLCQGTPRPAAWHSVHDLFLG